MTNTAAASSTTAFMKAITGNIRAAVAVTVVKTFEPHLAFDCVNALAKERGVPFQGWTCVKGVMTYNAQKSKDGKDVFDDQGVKPMEFSAALRSVVERAGTVNNRKSGYFTFMGAHHFIADGGKPKSATVCQVIRDLAKDLPDTGCRVFLIVPPDFQMPSELETEVVFTSLELPSASDREERIRRCLAPAQEFNPNHRVYTDAEIERTVALTGGMTNLELENGVSRALMADPEVVRTGDGLPFESFISVLQDIKTEVIKRTDVLELYPAEDMKNVGGLDNLKSWVGKRKRAFTKEAREYGVDAPKGVALIGPPGTGKSLAAKAIASELGLSLIRFDVSRVFNSLVGSTEARIRSVLKIVEAMGPCVLMIDEIDKALGNSHGSSGDSGVSQRVLGAILTWMNDNRSGAFVVVTANRVDNLPAELLRKGRLDEIFSVTLPGAKDRESILRIHLRKRKQDSNMDLSRVISASAGYVPAELEAAVAEAVVEAFATDVPVNDTLIAAQLGRPLSQSHADQFNAMRVWAENNARAASVPDEEASIPEVSVTDGRTLTF